MFIYDKYNSQLPLWRDVATYDRDNSSCLNLLNHDNRLIGLNNKQTTHRKKGFAKNFVKYRFENNCVKH